MMERQRRQEKLEEKRRLEGSLADYFREAWQVLEPGRKLIWSWYYDLLSEYFYLIRENLWHQHFPGTAGLIINVPPRTAKSTFASICFPTWCWTTKPESRFLCASYAGGLSSEHSLKRRDLILSKWYQERWGQMVKLKFDQREKNDFQNTRMGQMIATSVGGTGIGRGGDTAILDDPVNADQALSDTERTTANNWVDNTLRSRLNDPSAGVIVIIMQRLHEIDPTGYVMSQEPGRWIHVKLPLEAEENETWTFPISGRVVKRSAGEVLQPERYPADVINRLKIRRLVWASQYQQRPAPLEGNMIRRSDVRYYGGIDPVTGLHDKPLPERFDFTVVSADCAFKDLETSDRVAIGTIGVKWPDRYALEVVDKNLDLDATETEIKRQVLKYKANAIYVEDKANGPAVVKRLKRVCFGVRAITPEGGKHSRMFAAAPSWHSGNWYVDRTAAWTEPFLTQLMLFPNAAHDDMVDMMSQAEIQIQNKGLRLGLLDYTAQEVEKLKPRELNGQSNIHGSNGSNGGVIPDMVMKSDDLSKPAAKTQDDLNRPPAGQEAKVSQNDVSDRPPCPKCQSTSVTRVAGHWICTSCGNEWGGTSMPPSGISRRTV